MRNFSSRHDGMLAVNDSDRIHLFGELMLDLARGCVTRSGEPIHLRPQTYDVLRLLVENRGHLISKDHLIEEVWKGRAVTDGSLVKCIEELREALGPEAREFIRNVHGRGYIFDTGGDPASGSVRMTRSDEIEVLRVTVEEHDDHPEAANEAKALPAAKARTTVITAGAVILSVAAAAAFVWYKSAFQRPSPARGELSLLRLTNGIKPLDAAISPNGDYFVYNELADDGARLWLQQVGSASRVEIVPHSERVYSGKTFSPDGRFVYFIAADDAAGEPSLYRVAAIGGPQTKILSGVARPVSFSPDGREMVFIRVDTQTGTSALVIADSDGSQRILMQPDSRGYLVGSPAWSPDGSMIAFAMVDTQKTSGSGSFGLFSIDPSGGPIKSITEERWDNIYRIVWTYNGGGLVMVATREAESYSTRRDQVYYLSFPGGESRRLTFDGSRHQEWSLGVTKDDAIIAIPFNRSSQIWSMDSNGDATSAFQISHGFGDGRAGLAPLPDGKVGFIARSGDEINIWLMNVDGTGLEQLPGSLQVVEELRADPKGRFFVVSAFKQGYSHLFRLDLDGKNIKQLTFGEGHEVDSTVSPDGNWVVYQSTILTIKTALFRIPSEGGEPVPFGDGECSTPNYSPRGDLLSCIRGDQIVVLSVADGTQIKSYELPPYSRVNFGARWTPDGRGLVYILIEKLSSNLWIQRLDGGKPRPLTNFTGGEIYNYAFSIDGTRLFVARGYQINDAVLIRNFR